MFTSRRWRRKQTGRRQSGNVRTRVGKVTILTGRHAAEPDVALCTATVPPFVTAAAAAASHVAVRTTTAAALPASLPAAATTDAGKRLWTSEPCWTDFAMCTVATTTANFDSIFHCVQDDKNSRWSGSTHCCLKLCNLAFTPYLIPMSGYAPEKIVDAWTVQLRSVPMKNNEYVFVVIVTPMSVWSVAEIPTEELTFNCFFFWNGIVSGRILWLTSVVVEVSQ